MYQTTTNYHLVVNNKEAHLSINNNRLKQYNGGKYYLNDNDEFQLELTNDSINRVLVKIKLNGKFISTNGLILNANSHHYLERYIDTNRKFKFKTFDVDDVKETKKAREQNGKVEVFFYEEITPIPYSISYTPEWYPTSTTTFGGQPLYRSVLSANTVNCTSGNITASNTNTVFNTSTEFGETFDGKGDGSRSIEPSQVETGRVDEGGKSKQSFQPTTGQFSSFISKKVEFQILPSSQKPMEVNELREYCSECGIRIRKRSWKFCPQCGHKL